MDTQSMDLNSKFGIQKDRYSCGQKKDRKLFTWIDTGLKKN